MNLAVVFGIIVVASSISLALSFVMHESYTRDFLERTKRERQEDLQREAALYSELRNAIDRANTEAEGAHFELLKRLEECKAGR